MSFAGTMRLQDMTTTILALLLKPATSLKLFGGQPRSWAVQLRTVPGLWVQDWTELWSCASTCHLATVSMNPCCEAQVELHVTNVLATGVEVIIAVFHC